MLLGVLDVIITVNINCYAEKHDDFILDENSLCTGK